MEKSGKLANQGKVRIFSYKCEMKWDGSWNNIINHVVFFLSYVTLKSPIIDYGGGIDNYVVSFLFSIFKYNKWIE